MFCNGFIDKIILNADDFNNVSHLMGTKSNSTNNVCTNNNNKETDQFNKRINDKVVMKEEMMRNENIETNEPLNEPKPAEVPDKSNAFTKNVIESGTAKENGVPKNKSLIAPIKKTDG